MKKIVYLMLLMIVLLGLSCTRSEKIDIYLLLGQSNMAGRGNMTINDTLALDDVYLLSDKNQWEQASQPLNKYSTIRKSIKMQGINLGYEFGRMLSRETKSKIGLVVNARGGSSIKLWQKDSLYYNEALDRALAAQKSGLIKAIIWHQGSADKSMKEKYLSKLKAMTLSFREDLNIENLPIFVGELGDWRASSRKFNAMISHVTDSIPNAFLVSSEGLIHKTGDSLHFDAHSTNTLGKRYAEMVLKNID